MEADSVAVSTVVTRLNGLVMEMARTWQIGRPGVRRHALHNCAVMAQEAAIDAAMAGAPVSGIDRAARRVIEAAGFALHLLHRSGHGIGVVQHDFPEDVPFNGRPLEAGELYAVEPGLYVPGVGGFRCADVVPGRGARAAPAGAAQGHCFLHGDLTALRAFGRHPRPASTLTCSDANANSRVTCCCRGAPEGPSASADRKRLLG